MVAVAADRPMGLIIPICSRSLESSDPTVLLRPGVIGDPAVRIGPVPLLAVNRLEHLIRRKSPAMLVIAPLRSPPTPNVFGPLKAQSVTAH